jgi:hypothetical protein
MEIAGLDALAQKPLIFIGEGLVERAFANDTLGPWLR